MATTGQVIIENEEDIKSRINGISYNINYDLREKIKNMNGEPTIDSLNNYKKDVVEKSYNEILDTINKTITAINKYNGKLETRAEIYIKRLKDHKTNANKLEPQIEKVYEERKREFEEKAKREAAEAAAAAAATQKQSNQQPPVVAPAPSSQLVEPSGSSASSTPASSAASSAASTPASSAASSAASTPASTPTPRAAAAAAPGAAATDEVTMDYIKDQINNLNALTSVIESYKDLIAKENNLSKLESIYTRFTNIYNQSTTIANSIKTLINTDDNQNKLTFNEKKSQSKMIISILDTIETYNTEITKQYEVKKTELGGVAPVAAAPQAAPPAVATSNQQPETSAQKITMVSIKSEINKLDTDISNDKAKYTKQIQESNEVNDLNNIYEDFTTIYENYTKVAISIKKLINTDGDQNTLTVAEKTETNKSIDGTLATIEKYKQEITNEYNNKRKELENPPAPGAVVAPASTPVATSSEEENIKRLIEVTTNDLNKLDDQIDKIKDVEDSKELGQLNSSISEVLFTTIQTKIKESDTWSKNNNNKLTTEVKTLDELFKKTSEKWNTESSKKATSFIKPKSPENPPAPGTYVRQAASAAAAPAPEPAPPEPEVPNDITNRLDAITTDVNRVLGNLIIPIKDNNNNSYKIFPTVTLKVIKQSLQGGTRKSVSGSHSRKVSNPKRATTRRKNNNNNKIKISNNKSKNRNNKSKISSKISHRISKRHKSVRH
jgi:hypothetical protein